MLNIFWISPNMVGEGNQLYGSPESSGGGWIHSLWKRLSKVPGVELGVAAPLPDIKEPQIRRGRDGHTYVALPSLTAKGGVAENTRSLWKRIDAEFRPDVIHIHGTEYPYGADWIDTIGPERAVVSIQGLISICARYYLGGIDPKEFPLTLRDTLRHDSVTQQAEKFRLRGETERRVISKVGHIIGRTSWDKAHVRAINPDAVYHYGGETLRTTFYTRRWIYDQCEPHTIFISQGHYPLKGLHKVLEALPLVIREFPDARIRLAGPPPFGANRLRIGGYGAWLKKLIKRLGVEDRLEYVGMLDEEGMCREYLRANLFLLPSAIENSPNSLGEAQMLEMPYLASYVGGTPDLCADNSAALYRFEETEMLAAKICDIFRLGADFKPAPAPRHLYDPERNLRDLLETYREVAGDVFSGSGR